MQKTVINKVQKSFSLQAENFETQSMNFSKQEYLDYTVDAIGLTAADNVLEAAAGTCACGRAIAPHVQKVTCLDATRAMLEKGKAAAQKEGIRNISFQEGFVEELPFPAESFDIVVTRLSFHHFSEMEKPFSEMHRVLKKGGKLVVIDMEAAKEDLRETEDHLETLRDDSHVKNRSKAEFEALFHKYSLRIAKSEATRIPVGLIPWMELTNTSPDVQAQITSLMETELAGGEKTGFAPYRENGEIYFDQRWLFIMGIKDTL